MDDGIEFSDSTPIMIISKERLEMCGVVQWSNKWINGADRSPVPLFAHV